MSNRKEKLLALSNVDYEHLTKNDLSHLFRKTLNSGIHGLCMSPYEEGQQPGQQLNEAQVIRRIEILKPYTKWIRSFSCTEGNELIPMIAKEYGLKTMVGAWLGKDYETNENEISKLLQLIDEGYVDIAAVGNEVMYRGDLSEELLIDYIEDVKKRKQSDIPVGYVDAYYEFAERPAITEACDIVLANCYPFWEGCDLDYSLLYIKDMYQRALKAANGKKVIITETGWPSHGTNLDGAYPSVENAIKYFLNTQGWAKEEEIEMFYFSSFDESWKVNTEGDVGAYWGLWDKYEKSKF